jgi:hypothetical protein
LTANSGKRDWQHFLEKIYNWQQILWENMINSTFWENNIVGSTFLGEKTSLAAHSVKKHV